MSLLFNAMTPVVKMICDSELDGQGGQKNIWAEGKQFNAAITFDTSIEAVKAQKSGATSVYTVTYPKDEKLAYHDVIKRIEDGKTFRITSDGNDKKTPPVATFQVKQVTAEEWDIV